MDVLSIEHQFVTSGTTLKMKTETVDGVKKLFISLSVPGVGQDLNLETTVQETQKLQRILSLGIQAYQITQA